MPFYSIGCIIVSASIIKKEFAIRQFAYYNYINILPISLIVFHFSFACNSITKVISYFNSTQSLLIETTTTTTTTTRYYTLIIVIVFSLFALA